MSQIKQLTDALRGIAQCMIATRDPDMIAKSATVAWVADQMDLEHADLIKKQPINTHRRLFDLVRYMRAELHQDNLLTDEEYGWLCGFDFKEDKGKPGSPSPRRLEDYDNLRAQLEALRNTKP